MSGPLHLFQWDKMCVKCGEAKPGDLAHFPAQRLNHSGLDSYCRACRAESERERRVKHAERIREADRARYVRDDRALARRAWREANPEREKATARERYARDPERHRARTSARARLRRLGHDRVAAEYSTVLLGDPCSYCGAPAREVDHIHPLVGGGSNDYSNLTAACVYCNRSKADRSLLTFLVYRKPTASDKEYLTPTAGLPRWQTTSTTAAS